jgi:molybdate transport system ATP-binding protein
VAHLADHLVVREAGRAVAQGPLKEVLGRVDAPIRLGKEAGVVLEGRVAERDARWNLARVEFAGGGLWVRDEGHAVGRRLRLRVLAKDVSLTLDKPSGTSILNHLEVTVREIGNDLHPAQALASLAVNGQTLTARLTHRSVAALGLHPGKRVWAQVKTVAVIE